MQDLAQALEDAPTTPPPPDATAMRQSALDAYSCLTPGPEQDAAKRLYEHFDALVQTAQPQRSAYAKFKRNLGI